jgi:DNA-binding transcriptional LysR family regulator
MTSLPSLHHSITPSLHHSIISLVTVVIHGIVECLLVQTITSVSESVYSSPVCSRFLSLCASCTPRCAAQSRPRSRHLALSRYVKHQHHSCLRKPSARACSQMAAGQHVSVKPHILFQVEQSLFFLSFFLFSMPVHPIFELANF